jgi:hypothetical protein
MDREQTNSFKDVNALAQGNDAYDLLLAGSLTASTDSHVAGRVKRSQIARLTA